MTRRQALRGARAEVIHNIVDFWIEERRKMSFGERTSGMWSRFGTVLGIREGNADLEKIIMGQICGREQCIKDAYKTIYRE